MKKTLSALLVAFCLATVVAFAQETQQEELAYEPSALTYRNAVVYKVFDHKDVVIVMYAKHDSGIAQVQIPKRWSQEYPRKLNYRTCPPGINPFMTVMYQNGEFFKVLLTLPPVTSPDNLWAVAPAYMDFSEAASVDTLEFDY